MSRLPRLRRSAGQRTVTGGEERVPRPVRREMKPEASDAPADAASDFEQLESDRPHGCRRQARPREDRAAEVGKQQQSNAVELQPEGVRAEAMTAKSVSANSSVQTYRVLTAH